MAAISCPYCGATMNLPLKFCVSCGRAVSEDEIQKHGGLKTIKSGGATKRLEDHPGPTSFDRAKKSYGMQRTMRQLFLQISYMLLFVIIFYLALTQLLGEKGFDSLFLKKAPAPETTLTKPDF